MMYSWAAKTLLGPTDRQGDIVEFLTRDMASAELKELLLIGLFHRHKLLDNFITRPRRGRPVKHNSVDRERASIILNLVKWQKRSMAIRKWIHLAQQIEAILDAEGKKQGKTLLLDGIKYFSVSSKRLENSVCQGMKELGVDFRLYQNNPKEFFEI